MKKFFAVSGITLLGLVLPIASSVLSFAALLFCCEMLGELWFVCFIAPIVLVGGCFMLHMFLAKKLCKHFDFGIVRCFLCAHLPSFILSAAVRIYVIS